MPVGIFAELPASEMLMVVRAKALQLQLTPRPYDARGVISSARAVLVCVSLKCAQYFSKRQSACFHKSKYNLFISLLRRLCCLHAIYPSPFRALKMLS
jgi:hypothetical protein